MPGPTSRHLLPPNGLTHPHAILAQAPMIIIKPPPVTGVLPPKTSAPLTVCPMSAIALMTK